MSSLTESKDLASIDSASRRMSGRRASQTLDEEQKRRVAEAEVERKTEEFERANNQRAAGVQLDMEQGKNHTENAVFSRSRKHKNAGTVLLLYILNDIY